MASFKILQLNCQGLRNKVQEIEHHLERNQIDIAIFNETKITKKTQVNFTGWNIAALTLNEHHGTMICTKKGTNYTEEITEQTDEYDFIRVRVENLTITAAYVRPEANIDTYKLMETTTKDHIIVGDLNAHNTEWGGKKTNQMGETVAEILEEDYILLNDGNPTHEKGGMLDYHIASKQLTKKFSSFKVDTKISDHFTTISSFGNTHLQPPPTKIIWKKYRKEVHRRTLRLKLDTIEEPGTLEEAEELARKVEETITIAKRRSAKTKNRTTLPKKIINLMTEKRKLRRQQQTLVRNNNKNSLEYLDLRYKVNRITKTIRMELKRMKADKDELMIKNASQTGNPTLFWKSVKKLLQSETQTPDSSITVNGKKLESNQEKAEAFANHLSNCNTINSSTNHWTNELERNPLQLTEDTLTDELREELTLNVEEMDKMLNAKKLRSTPGEDGITYSDLLQAPEVMKKTICKLITGCLWIGITPHRWKRTVVKMIPKGKKDKTKVTNYRPISLLSCLGKLLETKVKKVLTKICMDLDIFDEKQYAFLPNRGTQDSLTKLSNDIAVAMTKKNTTAAAFLDVEKAYDSVWHKGLLYRMQELKIPSHLVHWTKNYLEQRLIWINVNGAESKQFQPTAGVPQGSTISPLLYIIYVTKPEITRCRVQFADDIALTNAWKSTMGATNGLLKGMDELHNWCNKWRIKLNTGKTNIMLFSRKPEPKIQPIRYKDSDLLTKPEMKFLGITLQPRLQWRLHIKEINSKMRAKISQLHKLRIKGVSQKNLTLLYKGLIRPHAGYCTTAWANISNSHLETLQKTQNEALRAILDKPKWTRIEDLHELTRTPYINDFIRRLNRNYMEKCEIHQKTNITAHLDEVAYLKTRSKWKTPMMRIAEQMD